MRADGIEAARGLIDLHIVPTGAGSADRGMLRTSQVHYMPPSSDPRSLGSFCTSRDPARASEVAIGSSPFKVGGDGKPV
jgi:hypothetical protein